MWSGRRLLLAIRWRASAAAAVVGLAMVTVAVAVAGPLYEQGIRENVVDRRIAEAPVESSGAWLTLQIRGGSYRGERGTYPILPEAAAGTVRAKAATPDLARWFGPAVEVIQLDTNYRIQPGPSPDTNGGVDTRLVTRDDVCAHLTLSAGHCPLDDSEVLLPVAVAEAAKVGPGDRLSGFVGWYSPGGPPQLTFRSDAPKDLSAPVVAGIYLTPDTADDYWMGDLGVAPGPAGSVDAANPVVFALPGMFTQIESADLTVAAALPVRASAIDDDDRLAVRAAAEHAMVTFPETDPPVAVRTRVDEVLDGAAAENGIAGLVVPLASLGILMMTWYVLFAVVSASAHERRAEVAVARLRGRGRAAGAVLAAGEPVLLITVGALLGLAAGLAGASALVDGVLGQPVPLGLGGPHSDLGAFGPGLIAGAAAYLGALTAALVAANAANRGEIVDAFRQAPRPSGRPSYAVDAVVLVLAGIAGYEMYTSGGLSTDRPTGTALLLPAVVAVAAGVLAVRLPGPLAGLAARLTRRRGGVAWYLAVRQVARRPTAARPVLLLVVATALAVSGVAGWWTERGNRTLRAGVYLGADTVLHVTAPSNQALLDAVRAADPTGRYAMAAVVYDTLLGDDSSAMLYAVDARRMGAVATWRSEWGGGRTAADLGAALRPPAPAASVTVRNGRLDGRLDVESFQMLTSGTRPDVEFVAVLAPPGGPEVSVPLAMLPDVAAGPTGRPVGKPVTIALDGQVTGCPAGCRLLRLQVKAGEITNSQTLSGVLDLYGLRNEGVRLPLPGYPGTGWRVSTPQPVALGPSVRTYHDFVQYTFEANGEVPALIVADTPFPLPVVGGRADGLPVGDDPTTGGRLPDLSPVDQTVVAVTELLPGARRVGGRLADLDAVVRLSTLRPAGGDQQVWLAEGAPPGLRQALIEHGLTLGAEETAAAQAAVLARYGPALAFQVHLVGAVLTLVLAIATLLSVLGLGARRRSWELAAVRTLGVDRRRLTRTALLELLLVVGYAVLVGSIVGLAVSAATGTAVPLGVAVDAPVPPTVRVPGQRPVGLLLAALAGTLLLSGWLSARAVVHAADPARLREAP